MTQTFVILGDPRPQGRPRFARMGRHIRAYDPKESREYKETLASQVVAQKPTYIAEGAIHLECEFVFARPKSLPKRVQDHTKKPDIDNLVKALKDAMTGIVWHDDAQITSLFARKDYGDVPQTKVRVFSQG